MLSMQSLPSCGKPLLPSLRLSEHTVAPPEASRHHVLRIRSRPFRGMPLLPSRCARWHTPAPPRATHHTELCIQRLPSCGKPLLSSCCAPEHTPAPPKATCHARQPVTAFSLRLALSASAAASAAGKTPATSRAARARDGRRSRCAGRHPLGAPDHSMECGSSVLMSPDGTFRPSRRQCPQRVSYLHQCCMLSMIVE